MTRRKLRASLDVARVEEAIAAAERQRAIELRISLAGPFWGSAERVASRAFKRLAMTATRARNGVLILVAPWRRRVVVLADEGITGKVSPTLWTEVVAAVTQAFGQGQFTDGLVAAVQKLSVALAPHFPARPGRDDELPNKIDPGK
jgi:uncharacterized membrane protein